MNKPWVSKLFSDERYLKIKFHLKMGKKLNLENPQTFNEKLQWLKLYNRKDEYTMMADKYAVRDYIADKIGEEYLIPLLGVWDSANDIDFDALPKQFVLKCTHNSGKGMCICKDKSKLDIDKVRKELNDGLKEEYFYSGREWCYKNIKPRIVAEKYMEDESGELKDYKFMCFNGKAKCCFVCSERFSEDGLRITIYDNEWNKMPFCRVKTPPTTTPLVKPKNYEAMIELAEVLAQNIPFSRIDFYEINNKIYFGEITFFPNSGMTGFYPEEWDYTLGSWIELPMQKEI